jgi:hypothetical protein
VGSELAGDRAVVAAELGAGRADVLASFGDQASHLDDEHDRDIEDDATEGLEESLAVSE